MGLLVPSASGVLPLLPNRAPLSPARARSTIQRCAPPRAGFYALAANSLLTTSNSARSVDRRDDRRNDSQCDVGFDRPLSAELALLFVRHRTRGGPSRGADRAIGARVLSLQRISLRQVGLQSELFRLRANPPLL